MPPSHVCRALGLLRSGEVREQLAAAVAIGEFLDMASASSESRLRYAKEVLQVKARVEVSVNGCYATFCVILLAGARVGGGRYVAWSCDATAREDLGLQQCSNDNIIKEKFVNNEIHCSADRLWLIRRRNKFIPVWDVAPALLGAITHLSALAFKASHPLLSPLGSHLYKYVTQLCA